MDPVRNPHAPGAGQQPPELAGRGSEIASFDVTLERALAGRPVRSPILCGLRGVGKTVLLNAFRSEALRQGWGTGKIEGRAEQPLRQPSAQAIHRAVREVGGQSRDGARLRRLLAVLKSFSLKAAPDRSWAFSLDVDAVAGRADSGDLETDLTELFLDAAEAAADLGTGLVLFVDEAQDIGSEDVAALCGACHKISQASLPLLVVGAGLPHLPAVLTSAKSYAERLFSYTRIDRLGRADADHALSAPAAREDVRFTGEALDRLADASAGYPYFIQAYGKAAWDAAPRSPITEADVDGSVRDAYDELAVGFFGSRWERAASREGIHARYGRTRGPSSPVSRRGIRHGSTAAL